MTNTDKLLPCPYPDCGSEDTETVKDDLGWWYGVCHKCCAKGPTSNKRKEAHDLWNHRFPTPPPLALTEEQEERLNKLQEYKLVTKFSTYESQENCRIIVYLLRIIDQLRTQPEGRKYV